MRHARWFTVVAAVLFAGLTVGIGLAAQKPQTGAEFDQATAGMSRSAVAAYVFKTYECQSCHIATPEGGAGFTPRGAAARGQFAGCVTLLTALVKTVGTDRARWSAAEQRVNRDFTDFGCTFCHAPAAGGIHLTEIGRTLGALHLGCVQVAEEAPKADAK